ncbi:MAG: hypothetical protein RL660_1324 [Bacteroidota bacterium]|jgi:hypothetical protein
MFKQSFRLIPICFIVLLSSIYTVNAQQSTFAMSGYLITLSDQGKSDSVLIHKKIYDIDTNLVEEVVYNYDQEQPLIARTIYAADGKIAEKQFYPNYALECSNGVFNPLIVAKIPSIHCRRF